MKGFSAINAKLLRELSGLKGQIFTIALVLATGIASFIMLRGTVDCLRSSRDQYYDQYRFAHVFATLEHAPEAVARKIAALPGVRVAESRISEEVMVPIAGMPLPAYGKLLSLPQHRQPAVNALYLTMGRFPERGHDDEAVVLDAFAEAHGLALWQRLPVVINGKLRRLRIVGLARSPEFVFSIRPGAMINDPKRYVAIWMERRTLAAAYRLEGAFNEISLRLQPGADEAAVRAGIDRILLPYGGNGAFGRKDQISDRILTGELGQLGGIARMVPLVFLAVSVFLIRLVLGRLIALQRQDIATLKAIGYSNGEVRRHYLGLVVVVMLPGSVFGILGGYQLGKIVLGMYSGTFRFPSLVFELSWALVITALLVSLLAALTGALLAVRAAANLPPAEAMRPPAPARYRRSLLDRIGIAKLAGPSGMMALREVQRRPLRLLMSCFGIAGALSLMIFGRFGLDSLESYLDNTVRREQQQDLSVAFVRPVPVRALGEVRQLGGVVSVEGVRSVPIRLHHGHRSRNSVLIGLPEAALMRHLINRRHGDEVKVPPDGVLAPLVLQDVLGVQLGDRLQIELRDGERRTVRPFIAGFVDDSMGIQIFARERFVAELEGDSGAISSALVKVEPQAQASVVEHLSRSPRVLDVSDLNAEMQQQRHMHVSIMNVWTLISTLMATAVIFGVVYNNARISLTARSRELASLRVLGFSRREISLILLGGLALEVALAIPFGALLGRLWAQQFVSTMDIETFRWAPKISGQTYAMAIGATLLSATASAFWVRRSLDHLDLIAVLKNRE
jgi:putative ABC transport system permease protein